MNPQHTALQWMWVNVRELVSGDGWEKVEPEVLS